MNIETPPIEGLLLIEPAVWRDERGYFFESYHAKRFKELGVTDNFVQDNQSLSQKGTLRGLHFQAPPYQQGKLVRVIRGSVWDVAVDIRKDSPTYGKYFGVELSGENNRVFWIPPGFAHGFLTLEDNTIFVYKCTGYYNKESEGGLVWNDPEVNIQWNTNTPLVSAKDAVLPFLNELKSPF